MLESYRRHVEERAALGIPPLPLNAEQTAHLCELLKNPPEGEADFLMHLLLDCIPSHLLELAASIKASFLKNLASGTIRSFLIPPHLALQLLERMRGNCTKQLSLQPFSSFVSNLLNRARKLAAHTTQRIIQVSSHLSKRIHTEHLYLFKNVAKKLIGSSFWRIEDLARPLIFIVKNHNWEMRCALLSTPVLPSLNRSSKVLFIS